MAHSILRTPSGAQHDTRLRRIAAAPALGLVLACGLTLAGPAHAAGAIRAAYVEAVIPSKPFSALLIASPTLTPFVGPTLGVLGVTSVTLSNSTARPSGVTLNVVAVPDGMDCESANFSQGVILFRVAAHVPPSQTLQLIYPSPWVIGAGLGVPAGRHVCLAADILDSVGAITVHVSGLVN